MITSFNGAQINATPPISNISVNKFNVAFEDSTHKKYVNLSGYLETKLFVNWLLTLS